VDRCETEPRGAEIVNARAPGVMAETAAAKESAPYPFQHRTTFLMAAKTTPYAEEGHRASACHYGQTKLAGEGAALMPSRGNHGRGASPGYLTRPSRVLWIRSSSARWRSNRVGGHRGQDLLHDLHRGTSPLLRPFLDQDLPGGLYHAATREVFLARIRPVCAGFAARAGLPLKARKAEPIPLSAMKAFVTTAPPHTVLSTRKACHGDRAVPRPWQDALETIWRGS